MPENKEPIKDIIGYCAASYVDVTPALSNERGCVKQGGRTCMFFLPGKTEPVPFDDPIAREIRYKLYYDPARKPINEQPK